jgi:hypothetical protein
MLYDAVLIAGANKLLYSARTAVEHKPQSLEDVPSVTVQGGGKRRG